MKKKILSMLMTGALVLSVSSVAQAASTEITKDSTSGKYAAPEVSVESEFATPTIKVELSDTTAKKIAVNPYGLTTTLTGVTGDDLKEQLVNKVETISNDSDVALAVNATVKATIKGKAKLATAPVASTDKTNSIFAYLHLEQGATIASSTYDAKAANQIVFAAKEASKKAMVTLTDKNGANKQAAYKIFGSVSPNPTTMWADEDGADFSIVFDFEPRVLS